MSARLAGGSTGGSRGHMEVIKFELAALGACKMAGREIVPLEMHASRTWNLRVTLYGQL
jgi:hypothetical protein